MSEPLGLMRLTGRAYPNGPICTKSVQRIELYETRALATEL